MAMEFLGAQQPFAGFEFGHFAEIIKSQLRLGQHAAAISHAQELIGYAGWVHTSLASAELWSRDMGPLRIVESGVHEAAALTIVAVRDPAVTLQLIRHARNLHPNVRVFFKRDYSGSLRAGKKSSVLNFRSDGRAST